MAEPAPRRRSASLPISRSYGFAAYNAAMAEAKTGYSPVIATQLQIPPQVHRKLKRLRRDVKVWFCLDGLRWLCACLVILMFASLVVDWMFRMDQIQRGLILLIAGAIVLWVAYVRLLRPLIRPLGLDQLCYRVESRHRQFGQSLISAIQLAAIPDPKAHGVSVAMIRAAIEQSARIADELSFRDTLDGRVLKRNLIIISVSMVIVLTQFAGCGTSMSIWFNRNVLLGSEQWPQRTTLVVHHVVDGTVAVPRGDHWEQLVSAQGVVPEQIYVEYMVQEGAKLFVEQLVRVGEREFQAKFRHVLHPFNFRVYGGDAVTPWIQVRLVDRPTITSFEFLLRPPAYISRTPQSLPPDESPYHVANGSSIQVNALATKDLVSATLQFDTEMLPLELTGPRSFRGQIEPVQLKSGRYSILLTDSDDLRSKHGAGFTVKVMPDQKPLVQAWLEGIGGLILSTATIPVHGQFRDDHGIAECELIYQARGDDGSQIQDGCVVLTHSRERLDTKHVSDLYLFELEALGLEVGTQLAFHIQVRDHDDVVGPNVGQSPTFFFSVVTEQELRAELLRREQEQRQQFERLLNDQEDLLADSRVMIASGLRSPETVSATSSPSKIVKHQRLVGDRCDVIADRFSQIADEIHYNKLEEKASTVDARLRLRIVEPLRNLADHVVPTLADQLEVVLSAATSNTVRNQVFIEVIDAQVQVVTEMRDILRHMVKWEGYHEAITLLYEILTAQQNVNQETEEQHQRRIQSIFEDR